MVFNSLALPVLKISITALQMFNGRLLNCSRLKAPLKALRTSLQVIPLKPQVSSSLSSSPASSLLALGLFPQPPISLALTASPLYAPLRQASLPRPCAPVVRLQTVALLGTGAKAPSHPPNCDICATPNAIALQRYVLVDPSTTLTNVLTCIDWRLSHVWCHARRIGRA
ncbi:hypothetical protein B0H19DRAFT_1378036 [Mycena capillaripes]|nr:hypothetical protein B0H19DRAFT_1378036 [Mycena capillaripes]